MSDPNLSIVMQFLANLINERETSKEGYSMPVRWLCLRSDLQDKYLIEAGNIVAAWWADEQHAKSMRDKDSNLESIFQVKK